MKHKHADLIHAWADGAEIEWLSGTDGWMTAPTPHFKEEIQYRLKPLKVKMWQWIMVRDDGSYWLTLDFYRETPKLNGPVRPALWTEIEVDL